MDLGLVVLDKGLIDRTRLLAGKVDDLILEVSLPAGPGPEVVAIVTGPTALSANFSRPVRRLVCMLYRALGLPDPRPSEIGWEHVRMIDVVVELDIDRTDGGWAALA